MSRKCWDLILQLCLLSKSNLKIIYFINNIFNIEKIDYWWHIKKRIELKFNFYSFYIIIHMTIFLNFIICWQYDI